MFRINFLFIKSNGTGMGSGEVGKQKHMDQRSLFGPDIHQRNAAEQQAVGSGYSGYLGAVSNCRKNFKKTKNTY